MATYNVSFSKRVDVELPGASISAERNVTSAEMLLVKARIINLAKRFEGKAVKVASPKDKSAFSVGVAVPDKNNSAFKTALTQATTNPDPITLRTQTNATRVSFPAMKAARRVIG